MSRVPKSLAALIVVAPIICFAQQTSTSTSTTTTATSTVPASQKVVMKVGDTQITQQQFEDMYGDFLKSQAGAPVPKKKTTAENFAGGLMLAKEAEAQGLQNTPAVKRELEMNRIQTLSNAEYSKLEEQAKPTTQEISAYYDSHLADFDEVSIRRVYVYKQTATSSGHGLPAPDAEARAAQIQKALASGTDAKALIKDTKDALDVDPITFRRGDLPPIMAQAFDMKVGEWTKVFDTDDFLMMFEVVNKSRLTLAQATPIIEKKLKGEKLREEMDALKKKTGVWLDEEYFAGPVSAGKTSQSGEHEEKR
jgi:hypothetical protein